MISNKRYYLLSNISYDTSIYCQDPLWTHASCNKGVQQIRSFVIMLAKIWNNKAKAINYDAFAILTNDKIITPCVPQMCIFHNDVRWPVLLDKDDPL